MRLRHIEIFNAVYTQGSVSAAAQYLNITQPTASKILQHAELRLGYKLFERVKGRLIPTEEARVLYKETKEIIDRVESLKKTSRNIHQADNIKIRINAVVSLGIEHIARAIVDYRKKHPDIKFEIQTQHYSHLIPSLLEYDKDVGIAFNPPHQVGLEYKKLGEGEVVCIYANNEFDDYPDRIKLEDIVNHPIIGIEKSGPLSDVIQHQLKLHEVELNPVVTAQTYFLALNLVALGGGIAIVDEFTARSAGVKPVKFKKFDPAIKFSIEAMYLETKIPPKPSIEFLEYFKNAIKQAQLRESIIKPETPFPKGQSSFKKVSPVI